MSVNCFARLVDLLPSPCTERVKERPVVKLQSRPPLSALFPPTLTQKNLTPEVWLDFELEKHDLIRGLLLKSSVFISGEHCPFLFHISFFPDLKSRSCYINNSKQMAEEIFTKYNTEYSRSHWCNVTDKLFLKEKCLTIKIKVKFVSIQSFSESCIICLGAQGNILDETMLPYSKLIEVQSFSDRNHSMSFGSNLLHHNMGNIDSCLFFFLLTVQKLIIQTLFWVRCSKASSMLYLVLKGK